MREGLERFEAGLPCGEQANMAKMLAAEASWAAGKACIQTHGGYGFAEEYDMERKFRECAHRLSEWMVTGNGAAVLSGAAPFDVFTRAGTRG